MCECGAPVYVKKRGLCKRCYQREYVRGTFDDLESGRLRASEGNE